MPETDPLSEAMKEATLATLLGSMAIPHTTVGFDGNLITTTINIEAAFSKRLRALADQGELDSVIHDAIGRIDVDRLAQGFEGLLAKAMLDKLNDVSTRYGQPHEPNWLQKEIKPIAIEASKAALADDAELMDTIRVKVGMQLDRNKVGINVTLSDPEMAG